VGRVLLRVPRVRGGVQPTVFARDLRREPALLATAMELVMTGVSTRKGKRITAALWGKRISARQVSRQTLLANHWSTLHALGLVTDSKPIIFRSMDDPPTYLEIFTWIEGGFEQAHEHPDALAIWEPMESLLDKWAARPDGSSRTMRPGIQPIAEKAKGLRDLEDMDAVFAVLSHRSRRTILAILHARGGAMTSREVAARFDCSWATTSRHLRILKESGLVHVELAGREHIYKLDRGRLQAVAATWIQRFIP